MGAGAGPGRPGRPAGGAGRVAGPRARAAAVRADAGVGVHVLPRRRLPHGRRPASEPRTGLDVQLCGDAHLSNFGAFAAPDRRLIFSINDFDETLPGPFEWDVSGWWPASPWPAGTAASTRSGAARSPGGGRPTGRRCASSPRMPQPRPLVRAHRLGPDHRGGAGWAARSSCGGSAQLGRRPSRRTACKAFAKLTEMVDGEPRIAADPPLIVPIEDVATDLAPGELEEFVHGADRPTGAR